MIGLISDVTETGDSKAQEIVQSTQADYIRIWWHRQISAEGA